LASIGIEAVGPVCAMPRAGSTNGINISKRELIYNFSTGRALQTDKAQIAISAFPKITTSVAAKSQKTYEN
jgi:hypothetical protein